MGSDQRTRADLDAANVRIVELKTDFRVMRREVMRLEGENLKLAKEVEALIAEERTNAQ